MYTDLNSPGIFHVLQLYIRISLSPCPATEDKSELFLLKLWKQFRHNHIGSRKGIFNRDFSGLFNAAKVWCLTSKSPGIILSA
jgi:hypothetical protein